MTDMDDSIRRQILSLRASQPEDALYGKNADIQDILLSSDEYINAKNIDNLLYDNVLDVLKTMI